MSAAYIDFLSDELSEHKWLVEIEYYDTVNLTTGTLYYSTSTFGTAASDTPASKLYEPRLMNGYNFSAAANDVGQFSGMLPARDGGSIVLAQDHGDLDALRLYSFDGRSIVIRHGGVSPIYGEVAYSDYAVVFKGEAEGQALIGIDEVTIKLRNKDTRLEFPIQDRLYDGGRYWLYFDGAGDYVSCGHASGGDALDFTSSAFTVEFKAFIEAYPIGTSTTMFSRGQTGTDGWTIRLTTAGELSFSTHNGTTQTTTSVAVPLNKRFHAALVRSGSSATWHIEGVASNSSSASHSNPTTAARTFYIGISNALANGFNGFLDEIRIWNYARTDAEINTYMNRQLESNEVVSSLKFYSRVDDGTGSNLTEVVAATTHAITGAVWYPSLQGGADLQGVPLPDVWGYRWGVAPVLCDEPKLVYQVHSGSIYSLEKVFVGGVTIALDTSYTSMVAFLAHTTTAGKYDRLVTEYGTWFRLKTAPNFPVTCVVKGDNTGGTGYGDASTYRSTAGQIVRYIVCNRGPQPLTDPTDLDTTSFSDLDTANSCDVGDTCYDERTIYEVVSFLLGSIGAVGWFDRSSGLFSVEVFAGVAPKTVLLDLTEKDCEDGTLEVIDVGPPFWGIDLNYKKNDLIHTTTDIAQSIILADPVTADINWRFLMTEWRTVRPRNPSIRSTYKGSTIFQLDTGITLHSDAIAEGLRLLLLHAEQGQCIRGFFNQNAVQLDRMDAVTFHFQDGDIYGNFQSRLGTSDSAVFVVIAVEDDVENGGTWLTLYREAIS